jgi:arginine decarboxylase
LELTPKAVFLTRGVGRHRERLASFEEALRDARIAQFNLVCVSSIFPPGCKLISRTRGLEKLAAGQIVYCVMSRNETDENRRLLAASVGLAVPVNRNQYGYLSEHHSFAQTDTEAAEYAEDVAAEMLATTLGVEFKPEAAWDEKRELWKISGKIVRTQEITQSAIGGKNGTWTTVVAAAVFIV